MAETICRNPKIPQHYPLKNTPFVFLDCKTAFEKLSADDKKYAYHLSQASWSGLPICLLQCSPESPGLFILLINIFSKLHPSTIRQRLSKDYKWSTEEIDELFLYIGHFFSNLGNYFSFGDLKILPPLHQRKFTEFFESFASSEKEKVIWQRIRPMVYNEDQWCLSKGFKPNGLTSYYSFNCQRNDAEDVQKFLEKENISPYNTRLFKNDNQYVVMKAGIDVGVLQKGKIGDFDVRVECGDYSRIMRLFVDDLQKAEKCALNDNERNMLHQYVKSFQTGDIAAHIKGSESWVLDKGPTVETYMGFIETYQDPLGVRGEFESFVACVNKETSKIYGHLVDRAEILLRELPWPSTYENDKFLRPDFTSLDVITFASSGIPIGINIPNYDDIRQNFGFKNVSLQNVIATRCKILKPTFLHADDQQLYVSNSTDALDVQVALHELLGHGTGKLFREATDGCLNFDSASAEDYVTGGLVKNWYKSGETWDTVFSSLSSSYEECRAECVGIYLCTHPLVHEIFGLKPSSSTEDVSDVAYINWLSMVRSGLVSLDVYHAEKKDFGQAHCCARFAILKVLLEAGSDFVKIEEFTAEDGKPDIYIRLDRSKICTVGIPAIGEFLRRLQYHKSTADVAGGAPFFKSYTNVSEQFLRYKEIIFNRKTPRSFIVQGNLKQNEDGDIDFVSYDATCDGMIESYVDRYSNRYEIVEALEETWHADLKRLESV